MATAADWYARKLGQPRPPAPQHPAQASVVPQPAQSPSLPPNPEPVEYAPKQATASRNSGRCPDCDSGNYLAATRTALKRCYDCGYNERFDHEAGGPAGSGSIGISGVPYVATTQVHGVNNFHPVLPDGSNAIGHI